jgi:hypothetical protein
MLSQSRYSRAMSANLGEVERRLRSVEQRLERAVGSTSSRAVQTADHRSQSTKRGALKT